MLLEEPAEESVPTNERAVTLDESINVTGGWKRSHLIITVDGLTA